MDRDYIVIVNDLGEVIGTAEVRKDTMSDEDFTTNYNGNVVVRKVSKEEKDKYKLGMKNRNDNKPDGFGVVDLKEFTKKDKPSKVKKEEL